MSRPNRRVVVAAGAVVFAPSFPVRADKVGSFAIEAERMREQAIAAGDQPFGAVLVLNGRIVGYGPSRVTTDRDDNAHAERVALMDAQKRFRRTALDGAVIYSTSRPCAACQAALAAARISRMMFGPDAVDAGAPRP